MGRGTTYRDISAAIEAGERPTRAQSRSLLTYARRESERADNNARYIIRLERELEDARIDLEIEKDHFSRLRVKWNAMIAMLHGFLGRKLHDEGGDVAAQYRQALEERAKSTSA